MSFITNFFATTTIKGHSKGFSIIKLVNVSRLSLLKKEDNLGFHEQFDFFSDFVEKLCSILDMLIFCILNYL